MRLRRFRKQRRQQRAAASLSKGEREQRLQQEALTHLRQQRWPAAVRCLRELVRRRPEDVEARNNLAVAYRRCGKPDEARRQLEAILRLAPEQTAAWINLGNLHRQAGDLPAARRCYEQAVRLAPDQAMTHHHLGNLLRDMGDYPGALAAHRQAVRREPADAGLLLGLATAQHLNGELTAARATLEKARSLAPSDPRILNNLGNVLRDSRRLSEAVAAYQQAVALGGPGTWLHSNLLLALHYQCDDPESLFAEHQRFGAALMAKVGRTTLANGHPPASARHDARIRVGYLSGDLRHHPVASFLEPVLEHHDRRRFAVFCYATTHHHDSITARLASLANGFRTIAGLDDESAARLIAADRIDILVDLAGHTQGNRLALLARRAAPVQATWLGYPDTTGLPTVDYRITDTTADPPHLPSRMSETPARMDRAFLCFRPPADIDARKTLSGPAVLGSCSTIAKITDTVLDCWAALLRELPDSRLLLKNRSLDDPGVRAATLNAFASRGVTNAGQRVRLTGFRPRAADHLAFYREIDIALDTFPYNGTTTTCEALWMGVPVVTLAGACHAGRVGASLLTAVGQTQWIAHDQEEYRAIVRRLAQAVSAVRQDAPALRQRFENSALRDETGFCRDLEALYTQWRSIAGG